MDDLESFVYVTLLTCLTHTKHDLHREVLDRVLVSIFDHVYERDGAVLGGDSKRSMMAGRISDIALFYKDNARDTKFTVLQMLIEDIWEFIDECYQNDEREHFESSASSPKGWESKERYRQLIGRCRAMLKLYDDSLNKPLWTDVRSTHDPAKDIIIR